MPSYSVNNFTRCPSAECDNFSPIHLDYYFDGERMFLSFSCPQCIASSLEDDFEWYVRCPNCHEGEDDVVGRVEKVKGGVKENGLIWFECDGCGASVEEYVNTRWDAEDSDVGFEPSIYR